MGHQAGETIPSINNPFGLGMAMKESTGVGQEVLEQSAVASHWKLTETR